MGTGGAPSPGASALGFRPGPVGAALAAALAAVLAAATGCTGTHPADATAGGRTAASSPAPRTTSPEDLCARVVAHWSREVLDSDTYGDYQTMGLSNGQYDILRRVVDAARAEKRRAGARAADLLIDRRARSGCAAWYRTGGPSDGPWQ
ncbi:hypothetical protein [Streptomyces mangrovisoli]|uniref:Uncharacterized protein n=1 Tax=Streptomyces mangrovisoli TaxID=1428628 RepID=A0A1J4P6C0_9ACTN|nr:hypothetical protein [Streptomyces mangrovisoli]OIJ69070.1 hypothetical protein WN71_004615 [Streptomyces mangrovisoli]